MIQPAAKNFKIATLPNGLTLLGESNPHHQSVGIGFFVCTGARDETAKEAGVSHFLEHMMFKGSKKRNALQLTYDLGNIGAQANAYTSEENTVFYSVVLPEYFASMQEILCDMLRPTLDLQEFTTEKQVILEEIALYLDRPHYFLHEKATAEYFGKHPVGNSVLGSQDSIRALTRDEMHDYFSRRYAPSNMTLVASGRFDWNQFVDLAAQYCGEWKNHQVTRERTPFAGNDIVRTYTKKGINQAHVMLMSESASATDDERYAMAILSVILGDGSGSPMYWKLVASGLAEAAGADADEKDGMGTFVASASTEPERLDQVTAILREILSEPLRFSDADLERAKSKVITRVVLHGELPMGRLMAIGSEWLYRHDVEPLSEVIKKVRALTRDDIAATANRFPLTKWGEFRLVPE